jgi:hypothetical protein
MKLKHGRQVGAGGRQAIVIWRIGRASKTLDVQNKKKETTPAKTDRHEATTMSPIRHVGANVTKAQVRVFPEDLQVYLQLKPMEPGHELD